MACKYVKEFDFGPQKTFVKGYARGGSVKSMSHREMESTPTMEKREVIQRTAVKAPATKGMLRDTSRLGIVDNKNPVGMKMGGYAGGGCAGKYAKGGMAVPKAGMPKVAKVMGEFKAGELHSGSKSGPVVKNPKQAIAIAMSEARAAKKK